MSPSRKRWPATRRLKKTRLKARSKAMMEYFRISLEYNRPIKHTLEKVSGENITVRGIFGRHAKTFRYFQMELNGDWQNEDTRKVIRNLTGYSHTYRYREINYQRMIDEVDAYVKGKYLAGSNWTLFNVNYIKIREFARSK